MRTNTTTRGRSLKRNRFGRRKPHQTREDRSPANHTLSQFSSATNRTSLPGRYPRRLRRRFPRRPSSHLRPRCPRRHRPRLAPRPLHYPRRQAKTSQQLLLSDAPRKPRDAASETWTPYGNASQKASSKPRPAQMHSLERVAQAPCEPGFTRLMRSDHLRATLRSTGQELPQSRRLRSPTLAVRFRPEPLTLHPPRTCLPHSYACLTPIPSRDRFSTLARLVLLMLH